MMFRKITKSFAILLNCKFNLFKFVSIINSLPYFRVEVNFNILTKSLRDTANVVEKSFEIENKLNKMKENIDIVSGKIEMESNEPQMRRVNEEISAINKVIESQMSRLEKFDAELKEIKNERKKSFENALEMINKILAEFCQTRFNVTASLEATNPDEPYLDVAYNWTTYENPNGRVT